MGYNAFGGIPSPNRLEVIDTARRNDTLDVDQIVKDYRAGQSAYIIARRLGVGINTVIRRLQERSIEIRGARKTLDNDRIVEDYMAGTSVLVLSHRHSIARSGIVRRLSERGIAIRGRSEANLVQAALAGPAARAARVAEAHDASRGSIIRLESLARRAITIERRPATSEIEHRLGKMLAERGIPTVPQRAIGPYNVDLAAEPVAVEVFGGGWHAHGRHALRHAKRRDYLFDRGWSLICVWVTRSHPLTACGADEVVAFMERVRRDPAAGSQERMVWGDAHPSPTPRLKINDLA